MLKTFKFLLGNKAIKLDSNQNNANKRFKYNSSRPTRSHYTFCQAPFNNLYFTQTGRVCVCCFNQVNTLGTYPKQSVEEIWNGEPIKKLRKELQMYNLPLGCWECTKAIHANMERTSNSLRFDEYPTSDCPVSLEFQLSNSCNLACTMCNGHFSSIIRKNVEQLPPLEEIYDKAFVKQLTPFIPHLHETTFSGGEPFLIGLYYNIWEKIVDINLNCKIKIITNGSVLNDRAKDLLEKGKFHITVSLDSTNKSNYERIRVGANFERVVENIDWFVQYCKKNRTQFNLNFCPMTLNYNEIIDFVDFSNSHDATIYFNHVYYPARYSLDSLPVSELKWLYDKILNSNFPQNTQSQQRNKKTIDNLMYDIKLLIENFKLGHSSRATLSEIASLFTKRAIDINRQNNEIISMRESILIHNRILSLNPNKLHLHTMKGFIKNLNIDFFHYMASFNDKTFEAMMYRYFGK